MTDTSTAVTGQQLTGQTMLEVTNLDASYGQLQVLRGLNFKVSEGEVAVILGANGAGKTTTLRAICNSNLLNTSGSVTLAGEEISKRDTADIVNRGVAHVPQGRGTFPELSVLDNLEVGAYVRKDKEIKADIDEWFTTFPRLGERKTQLAGSLSGGEQQMLAVARALMSRPRMLLLDEPSLGLAPLIIEELFENFSRLNREKGITMLVVEQNANLALKIANHGYVIEAGQISLEGSADQLRSDPAVQEAYLG